MKENKTQNITDLTQLQNVLGVKLEKTTKTNKTLSVKAQVMHKVNEAMHKLLVTEFSQYFKHIETDVVITSKEGKHTLQKVSGYYLLFPDVKVIGGKNHEGFKICKPTTYVKGGNSYWCSYFKEVGNTTYNK